MRKGIRPEIFLDQCKLGIDDRAEAFRFKVFVENDSCRVAIPFQQGGISHDAFQQGIRQLTGHRPGGPPPQLVEKLQRIQRAAEQMQRSGKDVRPIQKVMEQVGPLLQKGRMDEAEKLIIEALKLAGEDPSKGKDEPPRDKRKS